MKGCILFAFFLILFPPWYSFAQDESRPDLRSYFDEYRVSGTFVMYDRNAGRWTRHNPDAAKKEFIPASTFDIVTTLIGIEKGVLRDQSFVFRWQGEDRILKLWERDLSLSEAFRTSCVPCFRQTIRSIEAERLQAFLDKLHYGNRSIAGGTETFWLNGGLRISADEQVRFLMDLYDEKLPVSSRAMKTVKGLLLRDDTPRYKLYGKTGWLSDDLAAPLGKYSMGWFVGYQERGGNVYFFATVIESGKTQADFASARVDISKRILKQLCVLE